MSEVHVTGGKGFLGKYVVDSLSSNYTVEVSDIDTLDVTDSEAVTQRFRNDTPDTVCHLAGLTGAQASIDAPNRFFTTNCDGTLNVLEACRRNGIKNFVFMSTLTVHGASAQSVDEASGYMPKHPYAGSKAAGEQIVQTYARSYGIRSVILRVTLIAGEGQTEPNAISEFVDIANSDGTIEIFGDGLHEREWLHPVDVGMAVKSAVDYLHENESANVNDIFIISSRQPVSMRNLAEDVISMVGRGRVEFRPVTRQAFSLCTKSRSAEEQLKWNPEVDIKEIIKRVIDASDAHA